MANSKDDVFEELLPFCQHIPLLYHISHLCLAHCPQLERLLCMRAVETRLLFASSENVLMRSAGTSQILVSSLFPMLSLAIEANEPVLAMKSLEAANIWITENVKVVDQMMERFTVLNQDMAMTTTDIITGKKTKDRLSEQQSGEIQEMIKTINSIEVQMNDTTEQLAGIEKQIEDKNHRVQNFASNSASIRHTFSFFYALVPFSGPLVKLIHDARTSVGTAEFDSSLKADLKRLNAKKVSMKQNEWSLQVQKIDWNIKLAKLIIEKGAIPDPVFLREVQRYLSKLQSLLIQFRNLWTKMLDLLGIIKNKTFVGEDLVGDPELKAEFLKSIQKASEVWEMFSERCIKAAQIVRLQSKDAYTFLEIDPASLSQAVWQKAYDNVKEQLLQLKVLG